MKHERKQMAMIQRSGGALRCRLGVDRGFRYAVEPACPYDKETLGYAVCRYIRHCPQLRDALIYEAVTLGLDPRGGKKRKTHFVCTKAAALELPGNRARISLVVKQGEILITGLEIR